MQNVGTFISPVLIGRKRELELLDRALHATQNNNGGCLLLAGEAGLGKSRLAAELKQLASAAHFLIMQGNCSEQDIAYPYAPWIDALRTFLALRNAAEASELLGVYAPELVKLLPELNLLLPSLRPTASLDPAAEKHRLFESIARFTTSLAATQPLLIILEDLQWSDEQSLEFLQFFIRRVATLPILILGTYRSGQDSPSLSVRLDELNRERLVEELQLAPLDRFDVSQLVRTILKVDNPSDWLDLLMPLTEGNPFFIEELTKSLLQSGTQPGHWDPLSIPDSIQHVVQNRVDELPENTRYVLSLSSVIGERFDFAILQKITAFDEPSLLRMLKELIVAQLIVELSAEQFAFRHAITRQVVYAGLMLRERKALHQKIGEAIEQLVGADTPATIPLLAYHFYHAGDWHKAIGYSQRAGETAQALYASREALTHFSHALEAASNLGIQIPLPSLSGRAQACSVLGDFENAKADYETLIGLAKRSTDLHGEWQALMDLGYVWQPRNLIKAGEYFQQALQLARAMDDPVILGQSLNRLGNWYFYRSQPREALTLHGDAFDIFQRLGDRLGMAETLQHLGMASYGIGDVIRAVAYYQQAIPLLRQVDDRQGLVRALEFLTMRIRLDTEVLGDINFAQLASSGEQAFQIAESFDWREGEGEALSRTAIAWTRVGEYGRGLELLQRAQIIAEEINHRHLLTSVNLLFGELYLHLLALDQARHHLELSFNLAQEVGTGQLLKSVLPLLVSTCIQQGDLPRAQTVLAGLNLTNNIAEIARAVSPERHCWSAQAELELALGNPSPALEIVDRLIASAHNLAEFGPHAIPWLSQLRAHALVVLHRPEDAAEELAGALTTARARGELPLIWRLHADLGRVYRQLGRRRDASQEFSSARTMIQDLASHIPEGMLRLEFLHRVFATIPAQRVLTQRQADKRKFGGLTTREREIAALIAQGKSNREIASQLVISEKTAERHVANILSKLGFNARSQIAAWTVVQGLDK